MSLQLAKYLLKQGLMFMNDKDMSLPVGISYYTKMNHVEYDIHPLHFSNDFIFGEKLLTYLHTVTQHSCGSQLVCDSFDHLLGGLDALKELNQSAKG